MASSSNFFPTVESSSSTDESSSDDNRGTISRRYRNRMQQMTLVLGAQMCTQSLPRRRQYIRRDREGSHKQILKDYFAPNCTFPPDYFRRRFRMRRELFLRILKDVEAHDEYFVQKKDCTGRVGCSSLQK